MIVRLTFTISPLSFIFCQPWVSLWRGDRFSSVFLLEYNQCEITVHMRHISILLRFMVRKKGHPVGGIFPLDGDSFPLLSIVIQG